MSEGASGPTLADAGWSFERYVAPGVGRSWLAYDVFELGAEDSPSRVMLGTVCRGPQHAEARLLRRIGESLQHFRWNGYAADFLGALQGFSAELLLDDLVAIILRDYRQERIEVGVSFGGLARCNGRELVGFRMGSFRLVGPKGEELAEETLARAFASTKPAGDEWRLVGEATTRSFPFTDWSEEDLVWRRPSAEGGRNPLAVIFAFPFDATLSSSVLMRLDARWPGA